MEEEEEEALRIQWPSREYLQGQLPKTITDGDNYSLVPKGRKAVSHSSESHVYEPNLLIHSVCWRAGRDEDFQKTPGWDEKQASRLASRLFLVVLPHEFAVGSQGDRRP